MIISAEEDFLIALKVWRTAAFLMIIAAISSIEAFVWAIEHWSRLLVNVDFLCVCIALKT